MRAAKTCILTPRTSFGGANLISWCRQMLGKRSPSQQVVFHLPQPTNFHSTPAVRCRAENLPSVYIFVFVLSVVRSVCSALSCALLYVSRLTQQGPPSFRPKSSPYRFCAVHLNSSARERFFPHAAFIAEHHFAREPWGSLNLPKCLHPYQASLHGGEEPRASLQHR